MSLRNKKTANYDVTNFSIREMTECGRILDLGSVKDAINRGAIYKSLNEPWNDDELMEVIKKGFRKYEAIKGTSAASQEIKQ